MDIYLSLYTYIYIYIYILKSITRLPERHVVTVVVATVCGSYESYPTLVF